MCLQQLKLSFTILGLIQGSPCTPTCSPSRSACLGQAGIKHLLPEPSPPLRPDLLASVKPGSGIPFQNKGPMYLYMAHFCSVVEPRFFFFLTRILVLATVFFGLMG